MRLNLKNKIIIIYLLCILIPVLVVNGILYFMISEDLFIYENDNRAASTNRFAIRAIQDLNRYRDVTTNMAFDNYLTNILETSYANQEAYERYAQNQIVDTMNQYVSYDQNIEDVQVYTSNETIPVSEFHTAIDGQVINESWYKRLIRSNTGTILVTKNLYDQETQLSRNRLRYYSRLLGKRDQTILFSMDVGFDFLDDVVKEEYTEGLYILVNQFNDIVYASNDTFEGYDAYDSILVFKKNEDFYYSEFVYNDLDYLSGWRVIGIFPKEKIYDSLIEKRNQIIVVVFLGLLVATVLISLLSSSINKRFKKLNRQVDRIKSGDFSKVSIKQSGDELGKFVEEFHEMTDQMNVLVNEVYEKEIQRKNLVIEKQQAELNALQAQVNPHFLYNVMNTIRMKSVVKGEKETAVILKYVAAMFRRVINWDNDLIQIGDEVAFVKEFLKVQKYRFEDRLSFDIQVDPLVEDALIPKMTIQTFVENASTHGLENQIEGCHLTINVSYDKHKIIILVEDNGQGMTEDKLNQLRDYIKGVDKINESVGLKNVYHRLMIYFKEDMVFDIDSKIGEGTRIQLTIPYYREGL